MKRRIKIRITELEVYYTRDYLVQYDQEGSFLKLFFDMNDNLTGQKVRVTYKLPSGTSFFTDDVLTSNEMEIGIPTSATQEVGKILLEIHVVDADKKTTANRLVELYVKQSLNPSAGPDPGTPSWNNLVKKAGDKMLGDLDTDTGVTIKVEGSEVYHPGNSQPIIEQNNLIVGGQTADFENMQDVSLVVGTVYKDANTGVNYECIKASSPLPSPNPEFVIEITNSNLQKQLENWSVKGVNNGWVYYKFRDGRFIAYRTITTPSVVGTAYEGLIVPDFASSISIITASVDLPSTTSNASDGYRGNKNGTSLLFFGYADRNALIKIEGTWE